jgi:hypothetical protein
MVRTPSHYREPYNLIFKFPTTNNTSIFFYNFQKFCLWTRLGVSEFPISGNAFTHANRLASSEVINQDNVLKLQIKLLTMLLTCYCHTHVLIIQFSSTQSITEILDTDFAWTITFNFCYNHPHISVQVLSSKPALKFLIRLSLNWILAYSNSYWHTLTIWTRRVFLYRVN